MESELSPRGVCAAKGFLASGTAQGIKAGSTKLDCALIASEIPASVAGMFTQNRFKAPPVELNVEVCRQGQARAVFLNSGNANACTGSPGRRDAAATATAVSQHMGIPAGEVCVCSTGVIGVPLPMDRILKGVAGCAASLHACGSHDAAQAIMTTDTVPKERAMALELESGTVHIGGIAKGSGMIAPNMATMIAVLTTDARLSPQALDAALRPAVESSFNCICVDNDMSTSDTVLVLANGAAGGAELEPGSADFEAFAAALTGLCEDLARDLVRDGEGATKLVEIIVEGAPDSQAAKTIARAIAHSQLCKTAFFGQDPNWGRIACAAGYAGVPFDPAKASLWLGGLQLMHNGEAAPFREKDAAALMKQPEFTVRVDLAGGTGTARFWTSDLSYDYVRINADYRT